MEGFVVMGGPVFALLIKEAEGLGGGGGMVCSRRRVRGGSPVVEAGCRQVDEDRGGVMEGRVEVGAGVTVFELGAKL